DRSRRSQADSRGSCSRRSRPGIGRVAWVEQPPWLDKPVRVLSQSWGRAPVGARRSLELWPRPRPASRWPWRDVYDGNPRWTALRRRSARKPGKTDKLDASVVALFVRQEAPDLLLVTLEDQTAILDLLT